MLTNTEENYLKALFHLTKEIEGKTDAGTNEIAGYLNIKPASANDMLKKLKEKELVDFEKYGKITLTNFGLNCATQVIRKHRLWETFLYEKLHFSWDEVHEVAEQLEHIKSKKLIEQIDKFLGYPKNDPHGDPIPDVEGNINIQPKKSLIDVPINFEYKIITVKDKSNLFLQYVKDTGLYINKIIKVIEKNKFDNSIVIDLDNKKIKITKKMAENIFVVKK